MEVQSHSGVTETLKLTPFFLELLLTSSYYVEFKLHNYYMSGANKEHNLSQL